MVEPTDEFINDSTGTINCSNQKISIDGSPITNKILSGNIVNDVERLKKILNRSFDVVYRGFEIDGLKRAVLIFIDGLVDATLIDSDVIKPILNCAKNTFKSKKNEIDEIQDFLQHQVITASQIRVDKTIQNVVENIVSGYTILLIDGSQQAFLIDLRKLDKRDIEEPKVEPIIRGPRDGFTESLRTNISLIRRRLKTSKLKMENMKVGRLSKTDVVIAYIDGVVKNSLVEEVRQRISRIDIDGILESGYIEELIEDNPYSIFPQFGVTERPDRATAGLLEGHVIIIIDNTPMVLIAPETFVELMQATEDYYDRYFSVSFITFLRYLFLGTSLLLPSLYIALLTFHQGMIPRTLLLTIASSREGVPFPVFIETLLMEIFFEGLQEAGVRLPRAAGQTVSIVGGLVIGQAAVQAGIVSAVTVIIVSITGIASFIIPRFNLTLAVRMLRFFMIVLAGTLGLYGMFIGILIILIHMAKLRSFGIPYLSPIAPINLSDLKGVFIRTPWWAMISRPSFMETKDTQRVKRNLRPGPPKRR